MEPNRRSPTGPHPAQWTYPRRLLVFVGAAVVLHLNYWLWDSDQVVLGLPVNLLYHVLLSVVLFGGMVGLVRRYWPAFLDQEDQE